jgi:hypothetical protein
VYSLLEVARQEGWKGNGETDLSHCLTFSIEPIKSHISIMARALLISMVVVGVLFSFLSIKD